MCNNSNQIEATEEEINNCFTELCDLNLKHGDIRKSIDKLSRNLNNGTLDLLDKLEELNLKNVKLNIQAYKDYVNNTSKYSELLIEFCLWIIVVAGLWLLKNAEIDILAKYHQDFKIDNLILILSSGLVSIKLLIVVISRLILACQVEKNFNSIKVMDYILNYEKKE